MKQLFELIETWFSLGIYIYIYTEIRYSSWLIIGNWRLTFTQPTVNLSYIGLQRRHRCPLLDLAARRSLDVRLHLIWFHGVGSHLTVSFWYIYIYIHVIMYIYIYIIHVFIYVLPLGWQAQSRRYQKQGTLTHEWLLDGNLYVVFASQMFWDVFSKM